MRKDPLRVLTRGLTDAVEHDPAFLAMRDGRHVEPLSWGNLASKLVEADIIDPTPKAVCDFLDISPNELRNPEIVICDDYDLYEFEKRLAEQHEKQYRAEYGPAATADTIAFNIVLQRWIISEGGGAVADELQAEIEAKAEAMNHEQNQEEYTHQRLAIGLLCIQRDAFASGLAVNLEDFVGTMLSLEGLSYFRPQHVADAIRGMLEDTVSGYTLDTEGFDASQIVLGKRQTISFFSHLSYGFSYRMFAEQQAQWAPIEKLLYLDPIQDHPLLRGNEK